MKKKYDSQIKYEEENPLTCFRSKKDEKKKIVEMAKKSKKSMSRLVSMLVLGLEIDFSKAYDEAEKKGYEKGYEKALEEFGIFWEYVPANSPCHDAIIEFLKEKGWGHGECPDGS